MVSVTYNEHNNTGRSFTPQTMSYSDYLDYWMKEHCHVNLKYHTIQVYENIIKNHIKPRVGYYRLSQITKATLQEFVNNTYLEYSFSKNFMKNILKVLKTSLNYATNVVSFIKENPALKVKLPRYYAVLTAYYTGLRVSEVYGLTWDDIEREIDLAIRQAYSYDDFIYLMKKLDYDVMVRAGKLSIRKKNYNRNIRIERRF